MGITAGLHIRPPFGQSRHQPTPPLLANAPPPFPMRKTRPALRPGTPPSGHASLTYGQLPEPAGQAGGREEDEEVSVGERGEEVIKTERL